MLNEANKQGQEKRVLIRDFEKNEFFPGMVEEAVQKGREKRGAGSDSLNKNEDTAEIGLIERIRENEKQEIIEAIKRSNGNIAKVSRELGMSRQKLYYRIKKYNI